MCLYFLLPDICGCHLMSSLFFPNFLTFWKQQQIYYSGSQLTSWSMVKTSSNVHAGFGPVDCSVFSFLLCLSTPPPPFLLKWTAGTGPLLNRWWYFDFTFPFPVYHILIRSPTAVTSSIQLHLLKRTQTLLSIWNIVRRPRKTSVFTVRKSNLASGASYYLPPLGQKNEISPPGTANPPLVCTAAAIQQNKIIPVAA